MNRLNFSCIFFACVLVSLTISCDTKLTPLSPEGAVPDPVSDVAVENLPGAAKLTYNLPSGSNLWYVKAEYEIRPGVTLEAKSSHYTNSITLQGFGAAKPYSVTLYAVGRDEKHSAPVTVTVNPETPPIIQVFESLTMKDNWGGIDIAMRNPTLSDVVIQVIAVDSLGDWENVETIYDTKLDEHVFLIRDLDSTETKYGLYVRDKWLNYSDTLVSVLKPRHEEEVQKPWAEVRLPTDTWQSRGNNIGIPGIWDGCFSRECRGNTEYFFSGSGDHPQWFTIDLKATVLLSRMRMWQRPTLFDQGNIKRFEIWVSNDHQSEGGWDNWTMLLDTTVTKPSGTPLGTVTNEDRAFNDAGIDFLFPETSESYRYLRFVTKEVWNPSFSGVFLTELSLWGQISETF